MSNSNQDLFKEIGSISKDIYFIFDVINNHFEYLSPAFTEIFGRFENLTENPGFLLNLIHPEDKKYTLNCWLDLKNDLNGGKYEFRINQNESVKYILVSAYPIIENGALIKIAGTAEDISLVKKNILYAEKINAKKNFMLEILAQDLKGPLGMISLMASSIQREPAVAEKENILASVQFIQDMCNRNIALVRNLVNQEFFESSEVEIRKERADLVVEIQHVIYQYKQSEKKSKKLLSFTAPTKRYSFQ
ncbi:MAG: ATPase [Sphingobacteriales bacterium]|nr:ATPase [Sphingobacteriales bacterium]